MRVSQRFELAGLFALLGHRALASAAALWHLCSPLLRLVHALTPRRLRQLVARGRRRSLLTQLLALCLLFTLLLAAAHVSIRLSSAQMLERSAQRTAESLLPHVGRSSDTLRRVLSGQAGPGEIDRVIASAPTTDAILQYALYDTMGRLVFATIRPLMMLDAVPPPQQRRPTLLQETTGARQTLRQSVAARRIADAAQAEIVLPVHSGRGLAGALVLTIDQSPVESMFLGVLRETGAQLALILAIAFGVPFVGYLIQVRRNNRAESRIEFLARHDTLTRLANRASLQQSLEGLLRSAEAAERRLAVHHLDLDEFKAVNETHGQGAGDELLREVARRLRETLRETDCIARIGGDEFVVVQSGIRDREQAEALAARIVHVVTERYQLRGHSLRVSASVGVALAPDDGTEADKLLSCAGLALYFAKSSGRSSHRLYEPSMHEALKRRRTIEARVRQAVEQRLFEVHYQPFYRSRDRKLAGFEALVRLRDEAGVPISPAEFVPIAEETGLIDQLGAFVLSESCRLAASWPSHLKVAVNLSPVQFRSGRIAETIAETLAEHGTSATQLELEVTEGLLLKNTDFVRSQLDDIKKLGAAVVLDDFGTGYSSLSYLWQFSFDKIKIDQSFVRALGQSGNVTDIVTAIVTLGRTLKARILAEGVETEEQAEFLSGMRCDQLQGYLLSRPLPVEKANELAMAASPGAGTARLALA